MKINSVSYNTNPIRFGNALSQEQLEAKRKLQKDIRDFENQQYGIQDDENLRIVKVYHQAFPSSPEEDTGIGYMNSSVANEIYKLSANAYDANVIKFMPVGELTDSRTYNEEHKPGAYNRSGLSIGADIINIPDLATKKMGEILSKEDLARFLQTHKETQSRIDYEATLGYKNQEYYNVNEILGIARNNFFHTPHPSKELKALRKEYEKFSKDPFYDELCSRIVLFPQLKDWGTGKIPDNFFEGFDENPTQEQIEKYNEAKKNNQGAIDFYKFKQFLAHKTIDDGVNMVHQNGLKAFGDMAIGWSYPETQVFPDAFKKVGDHVGEAGWGLPTLKYEDLLEKEDSPAHKLLRAKITNLLNHFDGLRLDVGWQYIQPKYENCDFEWSDGTNERPQPSDKIPKFIEQVAREVKGPDFDQKNIIYECEANITDFDIENPKVVKVLNSIQGRPIFSTENEHQNNSKGWGSIAFLRENCGININKCVVQTNNHDGQGILNCANDYGKSSEQVGAMMRSLKLREQDGISKGWEKLKDDSNHNAHLRKYTTGRLAEVDNIGTAILINDLLGRSDKIDYHGKDPNKDYKTRLEPEVIRNYYKALSDGIGYNYGAVKLLKAECTGLKDKNPELYERAKKFAIYESRNDGIYSTEDANRSDYGKIDIESKSLDELKSINILG